MEECYKNEGCSSSVLYMLLSASLKVATGIMYF